MKLEIADLSLIGDRPENEDDYTVITQEAWIFAAIADGMGGHPGGKFAAKYFCRGLASNIHTLTKDLTLSPQLIINTLFIQASLYLNSKLYQLHYPEARTTCVAAFLNQDYLTVAHIGDSRAYLINDEGIKWRTQDHSYVEQLYSAGEITEEQMKKHPQQNLLLRCISIHEPPEPDLHQFPALAPGEMLLLCSDGFWGNTSRDDMLALVKADNLQKSLTEMSLMGYKKAQPYSDNITAIAIRYAHLE